MILYKVLSLHVSSTEQLKYKLFRWKYYFSLNFNSLRIKFQILKKKLKQQSLNSYNK